MTSTLILSNISPTTTMVTLFIIVLTLWLLFVFQRKERPRLPPGPRPLPIIGNLASLDPNLHSYFMRLANTHGPIFKLQLGSKLSIVVTSPPIASKILKDHDITFANRDAPQVTRAAKYGGADIVWTPYGPEWRMLRKVCVSKMLSNITLDSVYILRRREVRQTVSHIYKKALDAEQINVGEQVFFTIWNVVTSMLWGGTVQGEERASVGMEFRKMVSDMTEVMGTPNISDFFPILRWLDLQGMQRKMDDLTQSFDTLFERIINKRLKMDTKGKSNARESSTERKDFLQFLLKVKDDEDSKPPLTMTHVKSLLLDMIVGGTDTSSNSIEFGLAEVINKPEVMRKAQKELDAVVGKNNIVEESHIHSLPYLYCIMKETLRLHPVLPLLVPHCPSETCNIGGYTVPKGVRVFVNVWAIHRDPLIWENPLEFKPERFLGNKWDYSGSDFNYFPFGSGRRICAGIAMAERMFMYLLATLLHSFDWKLTEGKNLEIEEKFGIVLKLKNPLTAIPVPRLSRPELYE